MQPLAMILFIEILAIMLIEVPTPAYSDNKVETDFSNVVVMGNGTTLVALEFDRRYFEPLISLKEHENCALFDVHLDKTVFWCDTENSVIRPLSTRYSIISYPTRWQPKVFKVDFVSNKFYIIDGVVNSINIIDIYTGFYGIAISDLENPSDLILVPSKGIMFVALQSNCILKGNMDGSSLSVLARTIGISIMAADYQTQTIYWVDEFLTINIIDFSGVRVDTLILAPTKVHGMTVFKHKLYWFSDSTLQILDLKSKPRKTKAVIETSHNYTKIASTSWTGEVIRNPCKVDNGGCEHLCLVVPGVNGSLAKRCACKIGYEMKSYSKKCTHVNEFLLYTQGELFRGKILDGSSTETFTDAIMPKKFYTESLVSKDSIHFDYNIRKDKIYFSDDSNIWMIDIRSDGQQVKLYSQKDYLIFDVGFDWMTNILYFYEKKGDDYYLSMLGLIREPKYKQYAIYEHFDKNPAPHGLVIHPKQMSFYQFRRSGQGEMSLYKDYLAGFSPVETIDTFKYKGKFLRELIAIDYDKLKVYWLKLGSLIYFANIDGKSKSKMKLSVPVWYPKSVAVYDEWIFVSNLTEVWRFNKLTGDQAKRLIRVPNVVDDNLSTIRVVSPEVQVLDEDHPCIYMNGGCQHFCYAAPQRHCNCMKGYQLVNEFRCSRRLKNN